MNSFSNETNSKVLACHIAVLKVKKKTKLLSQMATPTWQSYNKSSWTVNMEVHMIYRFISAYIAVTLPTL